MLECNPIRTPVEVRNKSSKNDNGDFVDPTYFGQLGDSLRYLTCTKQNFSYGVGLISRFMESPR